MNLHRISTICLMLAALAFAAVPAHASRDAVQFGSDINVSRDMSVGDVVCFFCNVRVDGTAEGDVVVFFGSIRIAGQAKQDVVDFFGSVRAEDNASIGQDLVNFFGVIRLGENVSVGQDAVVMFGAMHAADSVHVGGDRVVQPGWIFWFPLLFVALLVIVLVSAIRARRRHQMLGSYPFPPPPHP